MIQSSCEQLVSKAKAVAQIRADWEAYVTFKHMSLPQSSPSIVILNVFVFFALFRSNGLARFAALDGFKQWVFQQRSDFFSSEQEFYHLINISKLEQYLSSMPQNNGYRNSILEKYCQDYNKLRLLIEQCDKQV